MQEETTVKPIDEELIIKNNDDHQSSKSIFTIANISQYINNLNASTSRDECLEKLFSNLLKTFTEVCNNDGNFVTSERLVDTMALPGLQLVISSGCSEIKYRPIALPIINKEQANEIIQVANKSSYGKAEETIFDENVRKSYELEPNQFRITNPLWQGELTKVLNTKIKTGLGIDKYKNVECKLYKLLLYPNGGHFDYHKDSEKECKQSCTLIIILPSIYEGGSFKIRHNSNEMEFDYSADGATGAYFISFYSDCDHAVMPLTSGYRTCLVYNIIVTTENEQELPIADLSQHSENVRDQLSGWMNSNYSDQLIVYFLEHEYTAESLVFGCEVLKGNDYKIYSILKASKLPLLIFPAFFSKRVNAGFNDGDGFEAGNLQTISKIFYYNDSMTTKLSVRPNQIFSLSKTDKNMQLIKSSEYQTGNYGTRSSKWYQTSCLILFPDELDKILALDFEFGLLYFELIILKHEPEILDGYFQIFSQKWLDPSRYNTVTKHDLLLTLLMKHDLKDMALKHLQLKCHPALVHPTIIRAVLKTFGYSDCRNIFFTYLFTLLEERTVFCCYSISDYLNIFEEYINLEDMNIITNQISKFIESDRDLETFYLFCNKTRENFTYAFDRTLFLPIFIEFVRKLRKKKSDPYDSYSTCANLLCEAFLGIDTVQEIVLYYLCKDFPKALELIEEYGYNSLDTTTLFIDLDPKIYFDNHKKSIENQDLQLFYSGFRKYIIENNLTQNPEEIDRLFRHSHRFGESDLVITLLKRFESDIENQIVLVIGFLDLYFVKSLNPMHEAVLEQWIITTRACFQYLKLCVSQNIYKPVTYKLKTIHTKRIRKLFNEYMSKQEIVMKYALENIEELLNFMLKYQSDNSIKPEFTFTRIFKASKLTKEREKREEEIRHQIELARNEKERKQKEEERLKKAAELRKRKKEEELTKNQKVKIAPKFSNDTRFDNSPRILQPLITTPTQGSSIQHSMPIITSSTLIHFTYQFGNCSSTMTGMPLTPHALTLTPASINFNTSLKKMNVLNANPESLSRFMNGAISWVPTQMTQEVANLFVIFTTQHFCAVLPCSPSQFFVLMPIQRLLLADPNDLRFVSIVTDVNGLDFLLQKQE